MARKRRLFSKDDILKQRAVNMAIEQMSGRGGGSLEAVQAAFQKCYLDIYEFISNKPYHTSRVKNN